MALAIEMKLKSKQDPDHDWPCKLGDDMYLLSKIEDSLVINWHCSGISIQTITLLINEVKRYLGL